MGPVVNLASRLQGQAAPGQILVGEATHRHTHRAFLFSSRSLELKGMVQPVVAYAVERALSRPEKARGIEGLRAELVGRDPELACLKEALAEVRRGRGRMVSLIGEAGVGKSRLVSELKQRALAPSEDGPTPLWLEGRCLELGMSASYWLFIDLFRAYLAFAADENERQHAERLVAALRALVEEGHLSEDRLEEIGPLLGKMLSLRFGTEWDERLKNASPEQIKHQTFLAIRDLILTLAKRRPVILVCEDIHWADSLSLDVISLLMESLTPAPLLLLCVYRPEREYKCRHLSTIAARKCPERYTENSLRELTPPQCRCLVESLLTIENLPTSLKDLILEKSRGNPFFVEEVVRSLIASGMVYQEGEIWRAKEGIETVGVPESVQSVILSRVDRLEREPREVLERAAVIGRLFRRRLLERTTAQATELEHALRELQDQALIYQERMVPEEEYSFKHVLTQETIYQNILRRRRVVFHQQVAEAIETLYPDALEEFYEQLAYHYERSGADEKAIEYLLKAGEKNERSYLNEEAIGCLDRALKRLEGRDGAAKWQRQQLQALSGLGRIHHRLRNEAEAERCFRQAIEIGAAIGAAPRERVRLYWWLADVLWWRNRFTEIPQLAEEGLALLGSDTQSVEAALMHETLALGHGKAGDEDRSNEFVRRNKAFLDQLPYSEELRHAYSQVIWYSLGESDEEATRWLQSLERSARQHHDLKALAQVHGIASKLLDLQGDIHGAIARQQQELELFTKTGDAKFVGSNLLWLGNSYLAIGDLATACAYVDRALAAEEEEISQTTLAACQITVPLFLSLGDGERAVDACRKVIPLHREAGLTGMWPTLSLGRAYLRDGKPREALPHLQEALSLLQADSPLLPAALTQILSSLEEACEDPEQFRALCRRYQEEHPEVRRATSFHWFLEPTEPAPFARQELCEPFLSPLAPAWVWHDPFGDCRFHLEEGLEIEAANNRDLWERNQSAPRVLRTASGSFAIETISVPHSEARPAIGGLLIWKDPRNFIRLDRGLGGPFEISLTADVEGSHLLLGRGRLPAERALLRLERIGEHVNALCRGAPAHEADACKEEWFTVGSVEFPVTDPVEVGLHAIGAIDRTIYPGAHPEGTAIRFETFELWGGGG